MQPADLPRLQDVGVNAAVVSFTLAIALATSLAFGILPALQFSGKRLPGALRESARGGASGGGGHMRAALVVAEMALAVVLLVGAGLLVRSFIHLTRVDPGFRAEQALSFRVTLQARSTGRMGQRGFAWPSSRSVCGRFLASTPWRRRACCRSADVERWSASPWRALHRRRRT